MTTITSQDVSAWMREQLAKALELSDYAAVSVQINQFKDHADRAEVRYSIYQGVENGTAIEGVNIEELFSRLADRTPQSRAVRLRKDAAELIKQAEELDAFTQS